MEFLAADVSPRVSHIVAGASERRLYLQANNKQTRKILNQYGPGNNNSSKPKLQCMYQVGEGQGVLNLPLFQPLDRRFSQGWDEKKVGYDRRGMGKGKRW